MLDWVLALGKVKADREARAEARQDKRSERRDDLQRTTLLDLQDAMMTLMRATAKGHHHDSMAEKACGSWGKQQWPEGFAEEARAAQARLTLLQSRVRNADLRKMAADLSTACANDSSAASRTEASKAATEAGAVFHSALELAGKLVREMGDML